MTTTNHTSPSGEELKPCPFCGSSKVGIASEHDSDTGGVFLSIKCSACRASSGAGFSTDPCPQTYQEVRDEWNRRAGASGKPIGEDAANGAVGEREMSLRVALDFADNPRPYPSLAAPADTNGELYRALKVIASAYRAALTAEKVAAEPVRTHPCRCGVCAEATDMIEQQAEDLKSASERLTLVASINASYVQEIHALRSRVATLKAAVDAQPTYLPCPICNGVEGCDHPFPERRRAAEKPIYQQRAAGFNAAWRDVSKECFDECSAIDTFETRIVYAAPQQPAQSAEQDEAAAYLVRGLDGYNEEYASVWIKRANADAAAAAIFRASITPLVQARAASTQSAATQPAQSQVALTDEQMMTAIKSVCGFDADKAEQWRPEALAIGRAVERALLREAGSN